MHEYSRRALLAGGGIIVGSVLLRTSTVGASAPASADDPPVRPVPTATATPTPPPSPAVPPLQVGQPTQIASLVPATSGAVMQQVEVATTGDLFITQSLSGSAPGLFTTIVTRFSATPTAAGGNGELDAMTIVDGGHGLGLHVERRGDRDFVWTSLQGTVSQADPNGGRLAVFAYTPGVFTIDAVPGGVQWLPQLPNDAGAFQEAIYAFDWAKGVAVERMYDFGTNVRERYTLRTIADLVQGVDRPLGRMTLPVNPPTMQGFATMGSTTFFRWVGMGNSGSGLPVATDPMALEQWDWGTGTQVGVSAFPTLGQDGGAWRGGSYEPEGCSVHREADGTASLIVGVVTGVSGDHGWRVYSFPSIGPA